MLYYAVCPFCGFKLLKAENGTKLEIYCFKCKERLSITVKNSIVTVGKLSLKDMVEI